MGEEEECEQKSDDTMNTVVGVSASYFIGWDAELRQGWRLLPSAPSSSKECAKRYKVSPDQLAPITAVWSDGFEHDIMDITSGAFQRAASATKASSSGRQAANKVDFGPRGPAPKPIREGPPKRQMVRNPMGPDRSDRTSGPGPQTCSKVGSETLSHASLRTTSGRPRTSDVHPRRR